LYNSKESARSLQSSVVRKICITFIFAGNKSPRKKHQYNPDVKNMGVSEHEVGIQKIVFLRKHDDSPWDVGVLSVLSYILRRATINSIFAEMDFGSFRGMPWISPNPDPLSIGNQICGIYPIIKLYTGLYGLYIGNI